MPEIGRVRINQPNQTRFGRVRINDPQGLSIVDPDHSVKVNVALNDLIDVSTTGVADGYTLVYDSDTNSYVMVPFDISNLGIANIEGGTF